MEKEFEHMSSLWARQLHVEFSDICWRYNLKLSPPTIEISKSKKILGAWQATTKTIKISSFLITGYCWSTVINVLKHEIAHQICSELFADHNAGHGKSFKRASDLLALPDEFRSSSSDLPESFDLDPQVSQHTQQSRRFISKVEKLLALAQSTNENEAALAMKKANELIRKYNIRQIGSEQDIKYTYVIINKKRKRIESFQKRICTILRDFFFVKIVYAYLYDPVSDQSHKTIEILGSQENVAIAEHCYHFLENRLSTLWQLNQHKYKSNKRIEKNSYYLGVLNGFYVKLQDQKDISSENNTASDSSDTEEKNDAMILTEDIGLNNYVATKFPRLRRTSGRGAKIFKNTYDEGVASGKKITLYKGVKQEDGDQGNLLGA